METKHVVIIAVVVVLALGFFGFRHFKGKDEDQAHVQGTYRRMIEMAQKSPRHGLAEMGMLIRRYHADNKAYPPSLDALYPKYVTSKSFIEEIDWHYEPEENNFYLSKTLLRGNQEMVASVDKALRPRMETGFMVATEAEPEHEEVGAGVDAGAWVATAPVAPPRYRVRDTGERLDRVRRVALEGPEVVSVDEFETHDGHTDLTIASLEPDNMSVEESEIASFAAAQLSARYLIWKDRRGTLGFGNVSYPSSENLTITRQGKWYSVKRAIPKAVRPEARFEPDASLKKSLDQVAADLRGWSLVWKDPEGHIGFGNVAFPDEDRLSISTGDRWVNLEKRAIPVQKASSVGIEIDTKKAPEEVAENLREQYLVWKDAAGVVGFGNVEYPSRPKLSINTGKGWDALETAPPVKRTVVRAEKKKATQDREDLASRMGGRYLVWKSKDGTIGFSDVAYPDLKLVSHIHDADQWKPVAN